MKITLALLFVITGTIASAQKFSVKGQLIDSLRNPLPAATVLLLNPTDSSLVNFSVGDSQGNFILKNVARSNYLFKVTFMGYHSYTVHIAPPQENTVLDLGEITMAAAANTLDAIEIAADRAPVTVKKDTIEFNAGFFKTQQNAVVEDLLKKLPGVEVDNDGNITAQGEKVRSITVDGKKFFGSDPKVATRNLPADAIDKVQVFDKQSDRAAFTGIDDGQREKTINLELKEDRRNALFGNMEAGAGSDNRMEAKANFNKFTKDQQLSFLGMANNTNQSGFGMDEYLNFTGSSRQMMGGGGMRMRLNDGNANGVPLNAGGRANGIMNTYAGGINVNNEFNNKTEVNGSYFYNYLDHDRDETTVRENFLKDGNFTFNEESIENNTNSNHRANVTLDHKIDSANVLRLTTNFTLNETDSEQASASENIAPDQSIVSENERQYLSAGSSSALNSNLLFRHRFDKPGRSLTTNLEFRVNQNETMGTLDAINTFYGDAALEQIQKQNNDQSTENLTYGAGVSYTEPIGNRTYLEANYNFRQNVNDVTRDVFDINNGETTYNQALSNRYQSDYQYHRAGINFRIAQNDYNFVAGTSFQETLLEGDLKLQDVQTSRSFKNILPAVRFQYNFANTKHLRFEYETSVQEPDIQQLQPVVDNSDPFNLYAGNPNLRPSYSQSWRLNFNSFNPVTFMNFFAFADIDYTSNAIINAQSLDDRFVRTITPVNVDRNLSINTHINLGIPVSTIGSRFSISLNFRNLNSIAMLNEIENDITQQTRGGMFRYNYRYKEILDLTLSTTLNHQQTRYEFDQPDQTFINSTYTAESNVTFLKNYALNIDFEYLVYQNERLNFDQRIPLLNLSLSRFVLKNKSGEIRVGVNNLLDKALGVAQTANINYLERVTTNSLGRYFMVSFIYALNKQLNPMAGRRGGHMMRIGG